ncbi:MAG: flagella basal body P-ring formation protein FlgA [Sphingomonas sp.]
MIRTTLTLAAIVAAAPAAAQSFQSTTMIDKAVAGFTGRAIGDDGGARTPVDTRLKLAACSMVTMNWRTPAHDSVVVACPDPEWRIYVPIRIAAPAFVAASPLAPPPPVAAKPAIVIKRGDPVSVSAGNAGFEITRDGIAVNDAAAGQRLLIKVQDGKPPIQAVAVEPGKAVIPGGE